MKRCITLAVLLLAVACTRGSAQSTEAPFRPVIRLGGAAAAKTDTVTRAAPAPERDRPATAAATPKRVTNAARAKAVETGNVATERHAAPGTSPATAVSEVPLPAETAGDPPAVSPGMAPEADAAAIVCAAPEPREPVLAVPAPPAAPPAPAAEAPAPRLAPAVSGASFVVSGLVGVSLFAQDRALGFGNGQSALWAKSGETPSDATILGADIRNTRINVAFSGGSIGTRVKASGVVELDFFGGFPGGSPSADEQPLPRLRLAYADLVRGNTTLRIGQFWSPLAGNVPVSASHVAFPLGLGSGGLIGWRNPGLLVQQVLGGGGRRAAAQVAVFRGSWTGADVLDQQSAGELAGLPQIEARLDLSSGAKWSAYVVGHIDGKDLNGVGEDTAQLGTLYGRAVAFGAKTVRGPVTLHGNVYTGRAIGQAMGQLAQFGDIGSTGGWAQVGYALSQPVSVWAFGAFDDVVDADAFRAITGDARLHNRLYALQVQFSRGDYTAGAELIRPVTTWGRMTDGVATQWERNGVQLAFSVIYRFSSASAAPALVASESITATASR